jgi:hypothetical protein
MMAQALQSQEPAPHANAITSFFGHRIGAIAMWDAEIELVLV